MNITWENLGEVLLDRISKLRWNNVINDLQPFIERPEDLALINKANCIKLIQDYKPYGILTTVAAKAKMIDS